MMMMMMLVEVQHCRARSRRRRCRLWQDHDVLVQFCFMPYFVYFTVVRDDVINVSLANYENKIEDPYGRRANQILLRFPPSR